MPFPSGLLSQHPIPSTRSLPLLSPSVFLSNKAGSQPDFLTGPERGAVIRIRVTLG